MNELHTDSQLRNNELVLRVFERKHSLGDFLRNELFYKEGQRELVATVASTILVIVHSLEPNFELVFVVTKLETNELSFERSNTVHTLSRFGCNDFS